METKETQEVKTENTLSLKKEKEKIKVENKYRVWQDTDFLWLILFFFTVFMTIISFLNIKGLTSIHSYSINVLFGMFSILFYVWAMLFCLKKIFKLKNTYSFKILHFSLWRLTLFFVATVFFSSVIYFVSKGVRDYKPSETFSKIFDAWFEEFKSTNNVALPYKYTAGVLGTFGYSLFTIAGGKIGTALGFIFTTLILVGSLVLFFISDTHLALISLSKKVREKAKADLLAKKSSDAKAKLKVGKKFEEKMQEQKLANENVIKKINEDKALKLAEDEKNQTLIKKLEKTTATISNPALQEYEKVQKEEEKLSSNASDFIQQNTLEREISKQEMNQKIKAGKQNQVPEINQDLVITSELDFNIDDFNDDVSLTQDDASKTIDISKLSNDYVSKHVDEKEFKKYTQDLSKTITLDAQFKKFEKTRELSRKMEKPKPETVEQNKQKRYSLFEDDEDFF
ncbi:hypothetical protein JN00_0098 [Metamycoplasma subdolum]|uniref:Uncharacterized protein n=1 Tax=Metamycoplasma subdolum TaxID=92407 RepID=A0A3M0A1K0_9BACT|nr:hypothetical protein [Metamycoplasma subdolum]RMA79051.1 hypothetical protein JN00_0098 [Metamycoplasma subdolum]WPB50575.1 hypothetical protein R9C05_00210 [Metamycoplasma subdolum]